jgi:ATP-dependent helicase HrpB
VNRSLPTLPITEALPALIRALDGPGCAVLQAPPGAGKSTIVPLALLQSVWRSDQKILMLEPRRLATRAVAARMSALLGEPLGRTVGYRTRLDTQVSAATRIEVLTEGILTRMLQSDAALPGVAGVIFDEFHERNLNADLALALSLESRAALREDLRILVMSATLDAPQIAQLLGGAPIVTAAGRSFDVVVDYVGRRNELTLEQQMTRTIAAALREHDGDVLAFLPGAPEIRRVEASLAAQSLGPNVDLHTLYGELKS